MYKKLEAEILPACPFNHKSVVVPETCVKVQIPEHTVFPAQVVHPVIRVLYFGRIFFPSLISAFSFGIHGLCVI